MFVIPKYHLVVLFLRNLFEMRTCYYGLDVFTKSLYSKFTFKNVRRTFLNRYSYYQFRNIIKYHILNDNFLIFTFL